MSSIKYRPEVDGLRCIAVLSVILYHAGFSAFSGGFVGVDIFFVISGYLITRIIYPNIVVGKFSFVTFYERRIRRILPALFVVLFSTSLAALFILTPDQLRDYGQSLVAVNLFLSNRYFFLKTGYFAPSAGEIPLLHTWSLAVEEQFYLLFPLLLIFIVRFALQRARWILAIFLALSIALCFWRLDNNQSTLNFFSTMSRGWELLLGASLAVNEIARGPSNGKVLWAGLGLLMIVVPVFAFSHDVEYPSWRTVIPVLGSGLILRYAQREHGVGSMLASKAMVRIGLISYSAYLWHQPIFALFFHLTGKPLGLASKLFLVALTLFFSYVSWSLVEAPFRVPGRVRSRSVWFGAIAASSVLIVIGLCFQYYDEGLSGRFSVDFRQFKPINFEAEDRHCRMIIPGFSGNCLASINVESGGVIDWLFLGDSHSQALAAGAIEKNPELRIVSIGRDGCLPFVGVDRYDMDEKINCREVFDYLEKNHSMVKRIALVGRYSFYESGTGFGEIDNAGRRRGSIHIQPSEFTERIDAKDYSEVMAVGLKKTLDKFSGESKLYFVHQVPELGFDPKACIDFGLRFKRDQTCSIPRTVVAKRQSNYRLSVGRVLANYPEVTTVDPLDTLCEGDSCFAILSDKVLYRDDDHLSIEGAGLISRELFQ